MRLNNLPKALACILLLTLMGCGSDDPAVNNGGNTEYGEPVVGDWVRVYTPSDPGNLNPFTSQDAGASFITENIFQSMYYLDPASLEMIPVLVTDKPIISQDSLSFTFTILNEAKWDNGSPITGHDYAFTVKAMFNPGVEAGGHRLANKFISEVVVDSANPKTFTVKTAYPYFKSEYMICLLNVIPKHIFDPKGYMDKYSVSSMNVKPGSKEEEACMARPGMKEFADFFNSSEAGHDPKYIQGSGPYTLESWTTGIQVVLVRKKDWWGDAFRSKGIQYYAWPAKLIYKIITDKGTAFAGMKGEEVDVMRDIAPKDFVEAQKGGIVNDKYNLFAIDAYSFTSLMMNSKPTGNHPKIFNDVRVRKAMAHLLDVNNLLENVYYGFGQRAVSPIAPMRGSIEFNDTLKPVPFDESKAKALLTEAGWADTDGDNVLDKMIDGKKQKFEVEILISNSSATGEAVALKLQAAVKKVGIILNIKAMAFAEVSARTRAHDFDMAGLAMLTSPLPTDLGQVWGSESYLTGGLNSFGFTNPEVDVLIDKINKEIDPVKRKPMYWRIQEIIAQEQPVIFLLVPKERVAIHKRFVEAKANTLKPNYQVASFWSPVSLQKFH